MKNKFYNRLLVSIGCAIFSCSSYALIPTENSQTDTDNQLIESQINSIQPDQTATFFADYSTITHKIKSGDSLSSIFSKLGFSKSDLHQIINTNKLGKQLATITAGKKLDFSVDSDGQLQQLVYNKNSIETIIATRFNDLFEVDLVSKKVEKRITSAQSVISSSLFLDGKNSGLSDKVIMQLADIFGWDIDFALNLRKGDEFTIVYEKLFIDDKEIDTGDIISAEFINKGKIHTAVKFQDKEGNASYFTPDGKSMRNTFLRTPVNFARISSHFNLKRKHPVLNRIRAHKGVDYAARTGTPIKTTGDGKITFRGRKGGYGRVVIVQHGQKYSTLYAHLSKYKKGQKTGDPVKQGEVIGYVGRSGLATGPHLHYEFRVNGVHRNPLTVTLPHTKPIKASLLAEFKQQTKVNIDYLNKAKAESLLVQNQQ